MIMLYTQHLCAACGSDQLRGNGSSQGHAKYQCKTCDHQAHLVPAAAERAAHYARVEKLLVERNSQRSIVRATGVSRMTAVKLTKKAQQAPPPLPRLRLNQQRAWEALELDELWTFVGRRCGKVWPWLAVERASRRIVAWVTSRRDASSAQRLWHVLPLRYRRHCWFFTDLFPDHVGVLPRWQHRCCPKGSGGTSIIEAVNCSLRQRCGVLVRKSCSFSNSLAMHNVRIKIVIDNYNPTLS